MGDGSSPCSLSRAGIWRARLRGCQLPDAILHGKRSLRPHSRAVQRLTTTELLSEAFQLASASGCATGLRTRLRHVYGCLSASSPLSAGSATAFGGAFARCHGSRLLSLRLLSIHRPAVAFLPSPALRKVFTGPAENRVSSPARTLTLSRLSASFLWLTSRRDRQSRSLVLIHSSNRIPSG
jgi:hypothetical protein